MNIQPKDPSWVPPPYLPIITEVEGLDKLSEGIEIIWFEIIEGNLAYWRSTEERVIDDGSYLNLGISLVTTGAWQLRAPIALGVMGYVFANYFK